MLIDDIRNGESPTLEFKCDIPDQALKYLKTVSAFANCSGGRIVFGVDSDGSICDMDEPFAARDKIADSIANGIEPTVVPEKWGLGIPNVVQEFVGHGLAAPEYTDWGNAVKVTVRRIRKKMDSGQGNGNVALNVSLNVALNERLVALVKAGPGINRGQIAQKLGVTTRTIDRVIASLGEVVVRRGSKKTGGYYLKERD